MTEDLNVLGARFTTRRLVESGMHVELEIELEPSAFPVKCTGKVCWSIVNPEGFSSFGVNFIDLLEEEQEQLERYLANVHGQPPDQ